MISIKDFEKDLTKLGNDYFVHNLSYVPDIAEWAKHKAQGLAEPHLPMKLIAEKGDNLSMFIQLETNEEMLSDVIKNLGIRWSIKDNVTDMDKKFNNTKKRLAYCFLKEYARSLQKIDGDALSEWAFEELEYLGYFKE